MIIVEILVLALALSAVVALLFRVQCPSDQALVLTLRSDEGSLRSGPPAFRVVARRGAFRTFSVGAVDWLDLSPIRVDTFVPILDADGSHRGEIHATAQVRVSSRATHLRRAAVRVLGMPRRDLDAIGEGTLAIAVRNVLSGRGYQAVEQERDAVESDVRAELWAVLDELGLEIMDLQLRFKHRGES